jgi:hypothetical protein
MAGDIVPSDPDANGFIDNEALKELSEKVVDHNRSIGLTIQAEDIQFTVHPTHGMMALIPALVRPSAKDKMAEDAESRKAFNVMMATNAEEKTKETQDEIAKMIGDGNLEDALFGDGEDEDVADRCAHENWHPSGFCMDCKYGLEEEKE